MFKEFFLFEIKYKLKQPIVWVFLVLLFFIGILAISNEDRLGMPLGNEFRNSPYRIFNLVTTISLILGTLIIAGVVASTGVRDYQRNYYQIMFVAPLQKLHYLLGRYLGTVVVCLLPFTGFLVGIFLGQFMPWIPDGRVGPIVWTAYLQSFTLFIVPLVLIMGAILYTIATLTQKNIYAFVAVTLMILGYFITLNLIARAPEIHFKLAYFDPFGITSLTTVARYWTVSEKNTMVLSLDGGIMISRLLWLAIGVLSMIWLYVRFSFALPEPAKKQKQASKELSTAKSGRFIFTESIPLPSVRTSFRLSTYWMQVFSQTLIEFRAIVRSLPFMILTGIGIVNLLSITAMVTTIFNTPIYPETYQVITAIQGGYSNFVFIIIVFYAGEIVWKERDARMNELFDTTPYPNWVPYLSKTFGLSLIIIFYLVIGLIVGVTTQLKAGNVSIEWGLYFKELFFVQLANFLVLIVFAVFLQTLANNKYLGYFLFILFTLIMDALLANFGFVHNLHSVGAPSFSVYSDMNGYGHYWLRMLNFKIYWLFFAVILSVLSIQLWIRGLNARLKHRFRVARQQFTLVLKTVLIIGIIGFGSMGCYIYYNTNVLNEYITEGAQDALDAEYEKKYVRYANIPLPKITDQKLAIDIYPYQKRLHIKGTFVLMNKTSKRLDSLHLSLNRKMQVQELSIQNAQLIYDDKKHAYQIYHLKQGLKPQEKINMSFEISYQIRGFENEISSNYFDALNTNQLVDNGTFFSGSSVLPRIGFNRQKLLTSTNDRLEQGLKPQAILPDVDDPQGALEAYVDLDGDWVTSDFVISTAADQIAIAPGKLQKEWRSNGRRYFHYQPTQAIRNTVGFLSGKYKVKRQMWGDVAMEIYYHPSHGYNVDRMMKSIKNSLQYFSQNFSPYQFKYARIVEFPRYAPFAQAFPGTMPYSEQMGFIADVDRKDAIDITYYIVAHEMSHQWWGHQTVGGRTKGASVLTETLAQYSALTLMEKEYGKEKMRRFLRQELDGYLNGRALETVAEQPLLYNDLQPYIHYRKGSLIMYGLKSFIGEQRINQALSKFVKATAFKEPPYPNALDFFKYIEEATPDSLHYLLDDWFKKITLYENKITAAKYRRMKNGKYAVYLTTASKKFYADGQGKASPAKLNEWIDLGVYDNDGKFLYHKRVSVTQEVNEFEIVVDKQPARAGIDPLHLYIDRSPNNNRMQVKAMK